MSQDEKAASGGVEISQAVIISMHYAMSAIAGTALLCRTMTPAEFERPWSVRRFIFGAQRACPPASMSEYEVLNDIIYDLAIEIRNFPFSRRSPGPLPDLAALYVAIVRPRKDTNFIVRCKYQLGK